MAPAAYRPRVLDLALDAMLPALPAIAIEGAKAVGKTESARRRARSVHSLDDPEQRGLAEADPHRLLTTPPPVLLDEWQHVPAVWDAVRRAVDAGAPPGRFLLTGSASPTSPGTHSGAGRIVSLRLRPMSFDERAVGQGSTVSLGELLRGRRAAIDGQTSVDLVAYTREILRSGFPGIRDLPERGRRAQLEGYLHRIVDRDFEDLGHPVRRPDALRRWMTAYAAATATTTTFEKIRDAAGSDGETPAKTTASAHRDVLERLFIIDPVPGWQPSRSHIARLTLPPKHHLADPALAAQLLGVDERRLLEGEAAGPPVPRDGTLLGALFESLATLSIRVYAQAREARVGHLRTKTGAREVDLIVERPDGRVVAIEVKLAATPRERDVRNLAWLAGELGENLLDAAVITTGRVAYRREDGIAVVPLALLGP